MNASEIRWDSQPPDLPGLTDIDLEAFVLQQPPEVVAAWIQDLLIDQTQLRATLHACMDALNRSLDKGRKLREQNTRLVEEVRQLIGLRNDGARA